jgi:D-beta-D-heptose 7-phosphate kinase/D-beta-D-heptose 1-phosphate adenosyltransferase
VYASGVFDVVHMGHIDMLRVAKKAGDILIVGVESDETVKFNKGEQRPLNDVGRRVDFLAELQSVNYVFAFEDMISYSQGGEIFRRRFEELAPDFVAVSTSENGLDKKMAQIQEAGCNIALITQRRSDSTTRLLRLVGYE